LIHSSQDATQLLLKPGCLSTDLQVHLITSVKHIEYLLWLGKIPITFALLLGHHCLLGGRFSQNEGRETLSTSHRDFNTSDGNAGLTDSFSAAFELQNAHKGIFNLGF
jgi:hypothetical protein